MRAVVILLAGSLALVACGEAAVEPADAPVVVDAAPKAEVQAVVGAPAVLTPACTAEVCRAGVGAVYGQSLGDVVALSQANGVVTVGWRAPVDGGQLTAECRIEADRILWRPLDRPVAGENRWMDQPGDPVVTFTLNGGTLTVSQALPDGTTTTTVEAVATEEEAP